MNGTEVYHNFTQGSSQSLQAAAQAVQQLASEYEQEATAIRDLQNRMNAAWTGSSGNAAYAGANPLAQAFTDSAEPLVITNASMSVQSDLFENARSNVVPVPPAPEKPSGWNLAFKSAIPIVGPSLAVSDVKSYQEGMAKTNAANENNVRVMEQYSSATGDTRGRIPTDYKVLPTDTASISLGSSSVTHVGSIGSGYTDVTRASSSTAYSSVGSPQGGGPVSAPPTLSGAAPVNTPHVQTGGNPGPVSAPPNLSGTGPNTGGGTGTSAYVPNVSGGYDNTRRPGPTPNRGTTSTGTGGGRGSAANRLYDDENRRTTGRGSSAAEERLGRGSASERLARGGSGEGRLGSGEGRLGSGEGRLGSGEGRLGAGKSSGAGNLASAASAEEAAASRNAARSANGAPMGAAGQRGRGEEDEEHQRPDYLVEADPDSIFGTDVRTTPPVIGE
ncbi:MULTISPECIES: PPE domain-containing protein [Amycolatopsis]|nr:PPE domain-containing protein [Amycolatopsis sacchari]